MAFIYAARLVNQQSIKLNQVPHSLLNYYGFYSFLWVFFPSIIILVLWSLLSKTFIDNQFLFLVQESYPKLPESFIFLKLAQIQNISAGLLETNDILMKELSERYISYQKTSIQLRVLVILTLVFGLLYSFIRLSPKLKARIYIEDTLRRTFLLAALVAILTTVGIISALLYQAFIFFTIPFTRFFFGTHWSPMVALREGAIDEDVGGSTGSFGMIPVIFGTLLVAFLAMCVAIPIGLFFLLSIWQNSPLKRLEIS